MSHLSQRPDIDPATMAVGSAIPHEAAALHVTGEALYTDDLVARTKDCLHAWPVQATVAKARITGLDVAPAYDVPGVVRVLTAADVPGVNDAGVKLVGVEAGGTGPQTGHNAATLATGKVGVLHGARSYLLQDEHGQVIETHSISAGLDYPGVGPEHSYLRDLGRIVPKIVNKIPVAYPEAIVAQSGGQQ